MWSGVTESGPQGLAGGRPRRCPGGPAGLVLVAAILLGTTPALAGPVVVLDAGHGGERAGARSEDGLEEKAVTLGVARQARAALERAGLRVVMTRDADVHVDLAARTAIANRAGAAAFVSIHVNSAPAEGQRGCETYVLSARASEDVSAALVDLENDGGGSGGGDEDDFGGGTDADLPRILADLRRQAAHERSARLAGAVQAHVGAVPALGPSRGLRQAPFAVLRRARVPAVLVELGYMTHAAQARSLGTAGAQRAAGEALARGILEFLAHRGADEEAE